MTHLASANDRKRAAGALIRFEEFALDPARRVLTRGEKSVAIQNKPLDVLIFLIEERARLVGREELLERFWPRTGSDESLTRCISTLRKVLDDLEEPHRFIETRWGEGYRFKAAIHLPSPRRASSTRRWRWPVLVLSALMAFGLVLLNGREPTPATPLEGVARLAVLPIDAPPGDELLVSDLSDRLIRVISRIEGVSVVARGSAAHFQFGSDPKEVGRRLDVDAMLSSRFSRAGERISLHAELVSTHDGSLLWSFVSEPEAALDRETQVAQLARSIAGRLWANLQVRAAPKPIDSAARREYLRGRYLWAQRSATSLRGAIGAFEAALLSEPDYVDALLGLADAWLVMPLYGASAPVDAIPKAERAARRALVLDPTESRSHAVLGVIYMQHHWDWVQAEAHLRRALSLNPNDATAEQWLGELHCYQKQFDPCREHLLAAASLDPLSPVLRFMRGTPDLYAGHYDRAAGEYEKAREELPNFPLLRLALGHAYAGQKDWRQSVTNYEIALAELGLEIAGGPLVYVLARGGQQARARQLLIELETLATQRYVPPTKLAIAYLGLGDVERCVELLQQALESRDDRLVYLAVDGFFAELHEFPPFREIAETVNLLDALNLGPP